MLYVLNSVIPQLLGFHYIKVESVLHQGSILLMWSSLPDKFFKNADKALFELKDLVKKVCYLIKILRKMEAVIHSKIWLLL